MAQGKSKVIRESFSDVMILGSDVGEKHAGTLFVESFRLVPSANSNTYISTIRSLVNEFNIDILIPTSEPEIEVFSGFPDLELPC